jgi:hypothetical protein
MANAVIIVGWYLVETLRLQRAGRTDPKLVRAQQLLDWLQANGPEIEVRDILRLGPASERSKSALEETLAVLRSHGWVREISKRPHRDSSGQSSRALARARARTRAPFSCRRFRPPFRPGSKLESEASRASWEAQRGYVLR